MATTRSDHEVVITAKAVGFAQLFSGLSTEATKAATGISSAFTKISAGVLAFGGLALAIRAVGSAVADEQRSIAKLNATLIATGNAAGLSKKALSDLAEEVQGSSVFDDDAIRDAETALLKFRTVQGEVFKEAIRVAVDLAAVTGDDLPAAAVKLGRAISDPEKGMRSLKDEGVKLSEQQIDLAARFKETGDTASAAKIVLDEIKKSVSGAGAAENAGLYGATKSMSRAWDDLIKALGRKIAPEATSWLTTLAKVVADASVSVGTSADKLARTSVGKIGGPPSTNLAVAAQNADDLAAEAGAREQRIAERLDQLYKREQEALRASVAGAANAYAGKLDGVRASLDRESALYRDSYERNQIASADFYEHERKAAEDLTQTVIVGLGKRGVAIENLLAAKSTKADERPALENQLQEIGVQTGRELLALKQKILDIDIEEAKAISTQVDQYTELGIRLEELRGDGDAGQAFDFANRKILDQIEAESTSKSPFARERAEQARRYADSIRVITVEQDALNKATRDFGFIADKVAVEQERIAIAVNAGQIGELEGLRRLSETNRSRLAEMQRDIDKATEAADRLRNAFGDKAPITQAAVAQVEQLRLKMEELAATGDLVAKKFNEIFGSAIFDNLQAFAEGRFKSFKEFLTATGKDLFSQINTVVFNELKTKAFGPGGPLSFLGDFASSLFGGKSGGAGAAGAAALTASATSLTASGTILTTAGTLLTTSAAALTAAAAAMAISSATSALSGVAGIGGFSGGGFGEHFASGGVSSGGLAMVGERGRELVILPRGAEVVPNHRLGNALGGGTTVINMYPPANINTQTARQMAKQAADFTTTQRRRG